MTIDQLLTRGAYEGAVYRDGKGHLLESISGFEGMVSRAFNGAPAYIRLGGAETGIPVIDGALARCRKQNQVLLEEIGSNRWIGAWPFYTQGEVVGGVVAVLGNLPTSSQVAVIGGVTRLVIHAVEDARIREELAWSAHHDALTGLPNRRHFGTLAQERLQNGVYLRIGIRGLYELSRGLGADAADEVVKTAAIRLLALARAEDVAGRLQDEDLALFVPGLCREEGKQLATTVIKELSSVFYYGDLPIHPRICVGVAVYPEDGDDCVQIDRAASEALQRAHRLGPNRQEMADRQRSGDLRQRLLMEARLRLALQANQLSVHYQPKVQRDGRVVGFEALMRWNSPETGPVSPAVFIPIAEKSGLMPEMGAWIFEQAAKRVVAWQDEGLAVVPVSVNVSALQLSDPDFLPMLERVMQQTGVDPALLEVELTEEAVTGDAELVAARLHAIRALGISVSIDDFGTGQSSLARLGRLPVDVLKIDRGFVMDLCRPDAGWSVTIVKTVLNLAHAMGLKVVAEGVETREQAHLLWESGCDQVQGFLYYRPMPEAAARALLS